MSCPRCQKESVTANWVNECCVLQSEDMKATIFASNLCVPHAIGLFGIDVTRRKPSPAPAPALVPNDGTRDEGGRL